MVDRPQPPLVRIRELARHYGVSARQIYNAIRGGSLAAYKVGNLWMVSRPEFEEWLQSRRSIVRERAPR